jgi:hypothetical protein
MRRDLALAAEEEVTFTQTTAEPFRHRDAIQFANGRQLLLQVIRPGIRLQVLRTNPVQTESELEFASTLEEHTGYPAV